MKTSKTKQNMQPSSPRAKAKTGVPVYQLHVQLDGTAPVIWRRFLVKNNLTFYQLHEHLQVIMGWLHCHLFQFHAGRDLYISLPSEDDLGFGEILDARKMRLSEFLEKKGDKIVYEYDFGDSWEHRVKVEKVLGPSEVTGPVPWCLEGVGACPPEDCGGVWGFENLKEILRDPKHEEHKQRKEWLDGYYPDYDPNKFSLDDVNEILKYGASKFLRDQAAVWNG